MKSLIIGAAMALLGAGAAQAESWEAVAASDRAVMAVDWQSLTINGSVRRVTVALVAINAGADAPFDYAASTIDVDCDGNRYATVLTHFYVYSGVEATDPYVGDGTWDEINPGALMGDVRREVCSSTASRTGYADDLNAFAIHINMVASEQ